MGTFWLAIGLAALGFFLFRAAHIWLDADQWRFGFWTRLGHAWRAALMPANYWWGARIEAMGDDDRARLLGQETAALGLSRADSERCPLCGAEVPSAWTVTGDGKAIVARGPIECPRCDFRLNACRHCAHFLPGSPQSWGQLGLGQDDMSSGRCGVYRTTQPVENVCAPDMARQLRARGYDQIRGPWLIVDSFLPVESCSAFQAERKRLKQGGVGWPDARRAALLRLLALTRTRAETSRARPTSDDELWLI